MSALKMALKCNIGRFATRMGRQFSAVPNPEPMIPYFRTDERNPLNHTFDLNGKYYTLDKEVIKPVFEHGGIPKSFRLQSKTFTETCIMIREPALEAIEVFRATDMSKPVNRVLLYGKEGTGKSITMAHLLHYAYLDGFLLVHVPWVPEWMRRFLPSKEITNSTTKEGKIDLPLDAAQWLVHFKQQNQKLLKNPEMIISNEYVWSKREITSKGSLLTDLIELGITRVKYSSDIICALLKEIKILSNKKVCKTFVAIDGFNSFFTPVTPLKTKIRKTITPDDISYTEAFVDLVQSNWCNGIVVMTVDPLAMHSNHRESHFPRYLLGKRGFEYLDPFIPIEVKNYTEKEFLTCMAYYRDRLWIRGYPDAETELAFISGYNPNKLKILSNPL